MDALNDLPEYTRDGLERFLLAARSAFADDMLSAVLFGSAAEGRLRATSDVNLVLVLKRFAVERVDALREPLRLAHAVLRLEVMFLLKTEITQAQEAFAVKFLDIEHRHRVLYGADVFARGSIDRASLVRRLCQVLLNLTLRLRERYVMVSLREEQAARVVADLAGPLRSVAMALLELQGRQADSPRAALQTVAAETGAAFAADLELVSRAREQGLLPHGVAVPLLARMIELVTRLHEQALEIA